MHTQMTILRQLLILFGILVTIALLKSNRLIENASGSIGTITQLQASNVEYVTNLRPVRQRGMFFNNPSWDR
jgi:hypothetical protein